MCTAISIQTASGETLFGRTMDFSYPLNPSVYLMPQGTVWTTALQTAQLHNCYSFIGIGQEVNGVVFADGVNEAGLAAAVLYFPGYASYDKAAVSAGKLPIAALELTRYLLGMCGSVSEAPRLLEKLQIVGVSDPVTQSIAPLHWMICDSSGKSMVIEKTVKGLELWNNPIGVLCNSPDFPWHMTNLRNYLNLSPKQNEKAAWGNVTLTPFGQGAGAMGLPGDFTPPSRFVRTAYLKSHIPTPEDGRDGIHAGFHILDNVSIPKGTVITQRGTEDYTQYTAMLNTSSKEYYFKTYENSQIYSAKLPAHMAPGSKPVCLGKLNRPTGIQRIN